MPSSTTFVAAVNSVMKRARLIEGGATEITAFTGNAMQSNVDAIIDVWNEVVSELFTATDLPEETAEGTLTLVADQSSYSFSTDMSVNDFVKMAGNPIDATNELELTPYPGGWLSLRRNRKDRTDYSGLPHHWAINTTNGNMEIDATPSSDEAGRAYVFVYAKRHSMSATTDTFPFNDAVVDDLVPVVAQVFRLDAQDRINNPIFRRGLSRAAHHLNPNRRRERWGTFNTGAALAALTDNDTF